MINELDFDKIEVNGKEVIFPSKVPYSVAIEAINVLRNGLSDIDSEVAVIYYRDENNKVVHDFHLLRGVLNVL